MAMMRNGSLIFTSDKAQQAAKPEYSNMIFRIIEKFAESMTDMKSVSDARIPIYTELLVGLIPDETMRVRMLDERAEQRKHIFEEYRTADRDLRDDILYHLDMSYFGKCISEFDKWIGIVKKQVILEIGEDGKEVPQTDGEV